MSERFTKSHVEFLEGLDPGLLIAALGPSMTWEEFFQQILQEEAMV